ncbi:hypothetical protein [Embleya hyalina]|uniref:Uncharacterized protein n=1 Tax=Embleya hyalina TaxID=516124 RepID=A0A401YJX5_9ACTN|nr:hypothetical protein [Embleya hyalina]GCD94881.1 hypothetical protein EHYA_02550 [Embleya hyalina]
MAVRGAVLTSALPTADRPNGNAGRTDNPRPDESAAAGDPVPEDDEDDGDDEDA